MNADVRRLCTIVGRYRGKNSGLKEHTTELSGEIISLLEEIVNLKREPSDIKDEATRVKVKCAELKRQLARHAETNLVTATASPSYLSYFRQRDIPILRP